MDHDVSFATLTICPHGGAEENIQINNDKKKSFILWGAWIKCDTVLQLVEVQLVDCEQNE